MDERRNDEQRSGPEARANWDGQRGQLRQRLAPARPTVERYWAGRDFAMRHSARLAA
jgi:hypothetical protein